MIVSNRVGNKIYSAKMEIETNTSKKIADIQVDNTKQWLLFKWNYPLPHQASLILMIKDKLTNWNGRF